MWNNQRAGQQHLNQAGHLFKRELRTRAKNCLRKNNWITTRGNKWLGDSQRAGHHQPDWETNQLPQGKTNELETADSIESRTPPARLGDKWIATSRKQMNWRQPESRTPPARRRQVKCHEGGQMNWSQPKSWTPPASLGNKWIVGKTQTPPARLGDKWIRDSQKAGHHQRDWDSRRAGHHQPDWETNELPQGKTHELETGEEPDTTSQIGRQMNRYIGKQKWIGDSLRAGHH